jgi:hypothetical protein
MIVELTGGKPNENGGTPRLCFSHAFDGGTIYPFDLGYSRWVTHRTSSAVISFDYPSMRAGGNVHMVVRGRYFTPPDYSTMPTPGPRTGLEIRHPTMKPETMVIELRSDSRDPDRSTPFPTLTSERYLLVPVDQSWRRRIAIQCTNARCGALFNSADGFFISVGAPEEAFHDLPQLLERTDRLIESFANNCNG